MWRLQLQPKQPCHSSEGCCQLATDRNSVTKGLNANLTLDSEIEDKALGGGVVIFLTINSFFYSPDLLCLFIGLHNLAKKI